MKAKHLILISFLLLALTLGAVNAQDNATSNPMDDVDILYDQIGDEVLTNERHDLYIYNIPDECEADEFNIYIDNDTIDYHGKDVEKGTEFRHIEGYYNYNLTEGNHTLKFEFIGNKHYNPYSKLISFRATPAIISIPDTVVQGIYASRNVEIFLADGVEGDFEIYADGMKLHSEPIASKRNYKYPIDSLSFEDHEIEVRAGPVKVEKSVNVTYYLDVELYGNEAVYVTTPWDVKKDVELYIDAKRYAYSSNGVTLTGIGKHNVTVTYPGDDTYPKRTISKVFEIKAEPQIIAPNTVYLYCGESKSITLTVYELSSVSITFNSKTNTYKPVNGKITFKIPSSLKPGKYTLKAKNNLVYAQSTVTVKHVMTLKSVSVKKSAKKLVLQATLKNKNPIKKKTVTFKFNGKTYKAKTNSKGIAKVTIKSSVLKKLKVGKKVTYQATYGKDTVKKTAKVRS